MMWSKLKQRVEERFADSVGGRAAVHNARYRHSHNEYGRGWITFDTHEIADMSDSRQLRSLLRIEREIQVANGTTNYLDPAQQPGYYAAIAQARETMHERGIYAKHEFNRALWDSLSLSIDDMLRSENGIIRALAMLDRRVGKRRLLALDLPDDELPLVCRLYTLRCEAEGIAVHAVAAAVG